MALTDTANVIDNSAPNADTLPGACTKINNNFASLESQTQNNGASLIGVYTQGLPNTSATNVQAALLSYGNAISAVTTTANNAEPKLGNSTSSWLLSSGSGSGSRVWVDPTTLPGGTSPEGSAISSTNVAPGWVLTADGNDGADWAVSTGGSGGTVISAFDAVASTSFNTTSSSVVALPGTLKTARYHTTADCWIAYGSSATITVDGSTGMFFARGTEILKAPATATHIAVRGELGIGAITITELEDEIAYELGDTEILAYSATSSQKLIPNLGGADYIRIYAPTDCYIAFGTGSATASTITGTYFEAGTEIIKRPVNATHIAIVQYSIAASAYITGTN